MSIFRSMSLEPDSPVRPTTPPSLKSNFRQFVALSRSKEKPRPRGRRMTYESLEPLESFLSNAITQTKEKTGFKRNSSHRYPDAIPPPVDVCATYQRLPVPLPPPLLSDLAPWGGSVDNMFDRVASSGRRAKGNAMWSLHAVCDPNPQRLKPNPETIDRKPPPATKRPNPQTLHQNPNHGVRFRVQGPGFRVQGSGFRVQGSGFRVLGSGFRVHGSWFRVQGSGFRIQGSGFMLHGSGIRVQGSGLQERSLEGLYLPSSPCLPPTHPPSRLQLSCKHLSQPTDGGL